MALPTYWTLQYNSVEKSLADWGFSEEPSDGEFCNMQQDTLVLEAAVADALADPILPYGAAIILRKLRGSSTGAPGSFTGGSIEFQGKRVLLKSSANGEAETIMYRFAGPWYDLEDGQYQQSIANFTTHGSPLSFTLTSELTLFAKIGASPGTIEMVHNGDQIEAVLQHHLDMCSARSLPLPYQIGTIEPDVPLNTYQTRDMKCAEVIRHCLQCSPDATVSFDYTTTPPTINIFERATATPVTLALRDGIKNTGWQGLTPREDLQQDSVVLFFKQSIQDGKNSYAELTKQKYPLDGPDGGPGVMVETVDLEGFQKTYMTGSLVCTEYAATRDFWKKYVPELQSTKIRKFRIGPLTYTDEETGASITLPAATIKDEDGSTVSTSTYPNVVDEGNVAPWMYLDDGAGDQLVEKTATIKARISYRQYDAEATGGGDPEDATNGTFRAKFNGKEVHARVKLTNGVTGDYNALATYLAAEPIPSGLAQAMYEALAELQQEGTIPFEEDDCALAVTMANTLNLSNGRPEWADMNATIQKINKKYAKGQTFISIGPPKHLSAGQKTQLLLVNRYRRPWRNPLTISTGKSGDDSAVALGKGTPKENTNTGVPEQSVIVLAAPPDGSSNKITGMFNADEGSLKLHTSNASGTVDTSVPRVSMALDDLDDEQEAKFREIAICTEDGPKLMKVLCTEPYDPA